MTSSALTLLIALLMATGCIGSSAAFWQTQASPAPLSANTQASPSIALPCSSVTTTAEIVDCESSRLAKANADLNRVYGQLMRSQDTTGKQQLRTAETAWLRFREANAAFHANEAAGGTLAPVLRLTSQADATEARVLELQKMLH